MFILLAIITILASDEANGIVNFETSDNVTINEPSAHSSSSGKASLRLVRAPGIYGIVRVPFTVIAAHGDKMVTDVTPASGQVTFLDKQVNRRHLEIDTSRGEGSPWIDRILGFGS